MKIKKIISAILAVLMLASACVMTIGAEDAKEYQNRTGNGKSLMAKNTDTSGNGFTDPYLYRTGEYQAENGEIKQITTAQEKLSLMDYRYGNDDYELYIDAYSGEVAVRCKSTNELLFTNPYNVGLSEIAKENDVNGTGTKPKLLSQLIVWYTDIAEGGESKALYSYLDASTKNQVAVTNIKNGLRVEYTIGKQATRSLVPRLVSAEVFEELYATMKENIEASGGNAKTTLSVFSAWYTKYSPAPANASSTPWNQKAQDQKQAGLSGTYPMIASVDSYWLDPSVSDRELNQIDSLIKEYAPEYTFEDLDEAHSYMGYESGSKASPLFRMALEYTLDEQGLVVRLPANSIRFNESAFRLDRIEVLPYMGAGTSPNPGYAFFPDGSGALFDFEEMAALGKESGVSGFVYGEDYAYHEISAKYQEVIRYPVYGLVETETVGGVQDQRGYLAIVESGAAMKMQIASYHGGMQESEYNALQLTVYPRPTDTYILEDDATGTSEWTVVSSRKYTGSYQIRYIMLTDRPVAGSESKYYECSYLGMAKAYREYLEAKGVLTRLTSEDVKDDIPLYIETFGALETTEKFLSIPMDVMTPLTTFDDIATMYDELKTAGITNVNFIMTGYTKGGMTDASVPYKLKWENAVSDEMEFEDLVAKAKTDGFGLFPDFDFVFVTKDGMFDGLSLKKHAVKTIDDRYTSKREYSATKHTYVSNYELALSSAYFSHFYEKFIPKYQAYDPVGISLSTLGSYLNSDFDEDEPYNRADSEEFTIKAFEYMENTLTDAQIMSSAANDYTWKYLDHITDIALDSSRYANAYASVPFLGIVLHGYVSIAGTPVNMEGNLDYAFLKALESGAALNFILSYRNTENLKNYENLSQYYSVRYDIWRDDVIEMYKELNDLLKGVQTSTITEHRFVDGVRVPDDDELTADAEDLLKKLVEAEAEELQAETERYNASIREAKLTIENGVSALNTALTTVATASEAQVVAMMKDYTMIQNAIVLIEANEEYTVAQRSALRALVDSINATDLKIRYEAMGSPDLGLDGGSTVIPQAKVEASTDKYISDDNMIVYEKYENGTAFLLNFNDFRVIVNLDGVAYTVDAYGYVVLNRVA